MEPLYTPGFNIEDSFYSPAMRVGNQVFISGQVPLDPKTGAVVGSDMTTQAKQAFANLEGLLKHNKMGMKNLAKVTLYISDVDAMGAMNKVYADVMGGHKPARACVEVSRLVLDMMIEIEAIAVVE
ncbi:RidA family protein [Desulfoluna sp.]|uniref:RidA family protein n=1 Tax=Desulfoluna sp. TaxID=2045199 RepID=UPI0026251D53|nr:RidA family protein [Desulfoluna sp.]